MAGSGVWSGVVAFGLGTCILGCRFADAADEAWNAGAWHATVAYEPESQTRPQEVLPPTSTADESAVNVTARMWYSAISKTEATNRSISTTQMPLSGGSVTYSPSGLGGTQFSLSGYYGLSTGVNDFHDIKSDGHSDLARLDIEALAQIPFGATGGAFAAVGLRYIDFQRKDLGTARDVFVMGDSFSYARQTHYDYFLGEFGVGAVTLVDVEGAHRFFGGAMVVTGGSNTAQDAITLDNVPIPAFVYDSAGASSSGWSAVLGADTHFGYAYSPSRSTSLSLRYRAFILSDLFLNQHVRFIDYSHYSLIHGPEVNFTYKFN